MKFAMISAIALMLQGCNQEPYPTEQSFHGSWIAIEESCESDGGVAFYDKGVVQTFESEGIWSITKDKLKITITKSFSEDGSEPESNSINESVIQLSDVSQNSFTAKYENDAIIKYKRCQTAEELTKKNVVQKIIWEWTGGYKSTNVFVDSLCRKSSDNLQEYLDLGWKIKSTAPFEQYVNGGSCQGRDIVLEREE